MLHARRPESSFLELTGALTCVKDWVYSTHNLTTFREYVGHDDRNLGMQAACRDDLLEVKASEVLCSFPGARNIFLFGSEDGCDKRGDLKKTMDKIRGSLSAVVVSTACSGDSLSLRQAWDTLDVLKAKAA